MPKKLTLLLISQKQLARIDVVSGKRARVKNHWIRERLSGESLATLADAAIRLGPKKTGDVWVLSTDFWTGVVHLTSDVAAALDGDELEQAIGLEAETYSGISAFESRLGISSLPRDDTGESRWWVTQVSHSDGQSIDQAIKQFGGKFAGAAHAALPSFPVCLSEDKTTAAPHHWRLHHCFADATIAIRGSGSEVRDLITLGDLATQRNQAQLRDWCESAPTDQEAFAWITDQPLLDHVDYASATVLSLVENANPTIDSNLPPAGQSSNFNSPNDLLSGASALVAWAETMATELNHAARESASMGLPVALAQKPPMTNRTAMLVACSLGLFMALACFGLYTLGGTKISELDSQIETLTAQKRQLTLDEKKLRDAEKSLEEKRGQIKEMEKTNRKLETDLKLARQMRKFQQTRWLKLVTALAESIEGDCWMRGLQTNDNKVTVQGMAVSNRDLALFASNLERLATPHGWRVHPAQMERLESSLIEFEVSLDASDGRSDTAVSLTALESELQRGLANRSVIPASGSSTDSQIDFEGDAR